MCCFNFRQKSISKHLPTFGNALPFRAQSYKNEKECYKKDKALYFLSEANECQGLFLLK